MKRRTYVYLLVIVAALLLMIMGCGPQGKEDETIKLGFIGNLSEPSSLSAEASMKLVIDEFNEDGGILGKKIILISEDTKGEIPIAQEAYKKLVMEDRVLAVVVGEKVEMGMAGIEMGAELYPQFPHIFINTIGSHDDIWHKVRDDYDKYKFAFQTYTSTTTGYLTSFAKDVMTQMYDSMDVKKLAIVYEDMAWTEPLREGLPGVSPRIAEVYKGHGVDIVYEATVSLDQTMFNVDLDKAAAAGAEAIEFVIGYIDEIALIKQWADSAACDIPIFIWGGFAGMPAAWEATDGKCLGVLVGSSVITEEPITDVTIPFMEKLESEYGVGAIFGSYTTRDSLYGFRKAVEEAGSTADVEAIIKKMETVEEDAVLGKIKWHPEHHYNLPYPYYIFTVAQWQEDGKRSYCAPPEVIINGYRTLEELRK